MGTDSAPKAEDKDDPMEGPSKKGGVLVRRAMTRGELTSPPARCPASLRRPRTWRPAATMAAFTDEAPVIPAAGADGTYACPDCDKSVDSAANHGVPLPQAVFPAPTSSDQFRQDFRGVWFRLSRKGGFSSN